MNILLVVSPNVCSLAERKRGSQCTVRIFGNQLMLHNKNETRSVAPAIRFLLSVFVCFEEAFAKALYFTH